MATHLIVYLCLAVNDCQVYRHATFTGPNSYVSCQLAREQLLERLGHKPARSRLVCEVE